MHVSIGLTYAQVWDLNSGEPMHKGNDLRTNVSVCCVNVDRDRIVLCCVEKHEPADQSGSSSFHEREFKYLQFK